FEPVTIIRHHWTSLRRSHIRLHHFQARNELWSVLMRCPLPMLPAVALFRMARQFGYALSHGASWTVREPLWWAKCLAGAPRCLAGRKPIAWRGYLAWMKLLRNSRA